MVVDVDDPPIGELRAGRPEAVEALVGRHYGRIHRYLLRLVHDRGLAEDLTQDTFLRAYLALHRLHDDSNVPAWLFRIATNLARQQHRRQRHQPALCWPRPGGAAGGGGAPDERFWSGEVAAPGAAFEDGVGEREAVQRALDRLPLDQRACLLLYAWTGYTCAEIGEILGRSTGAVRMLLVRARRRFRDAYDGQSDGAPGATGLATSGGRPGDGGVSAPAAAGAGGVRAAAAPPTGGAGDAAAPREEGELGGGHDHRHHHDHGRACGRAGAGLLFYPRGDLPRDAFLAVSRHLADCPPCRAALREVQATYRLLQRHLNAAPAGAVPESAALAARSPRPAPAVAVRARSWPPRAD